MSELRLWEVDHSYYCSESNYYSNEPGSRFNSWESFAHEWEGNDFDMNMVFRWDWQPNEYIEMPGLARPDREALTAYADRFGDKDHAWTLQLFYMLQRKGIFLCNQISVCKNDEPAVRKFLEPRFEYLTALWSPFVGGESDG